MLIGCDFSSSPSRKKPIVLALGARRNGQVMLSKLERFESLDAFGVWLTSGPAAGAVDAMGAVRGWAGDATHGWLGAFDLPFGLPRELVEALGWPTDWLACMRHFAALSRDDIRARFKAFCDVRPAGGKFAHRATDGPAGASPSMKWVNPPVAFMMHAGVPLLLAANATLPGLRDAGTDPGRIALEAYPGLLAREVLGRRSYKSDDRQAQTPERLIARKDLVTALEHGQTRLGLFLKLSHAQRDTLVDDASGDSLDAVLCLLQAAWADRARAQGDARYGLPPDVDPLEGWIVTA